MYKAKTARGRHRLEHILQAKVTRGYNRRKYFSFFDGFLTGISGPILIFSSPTLTRFVPVSTSEAMFTDWQAVGGDLLQATETMLDEQIEEKEEESVEA